MTTDETARLHLYEQARSTWDDEAARTLMTSLPWDVHDLATKQDLAAMDLHIESMEHRLQSSIDRAFVRTMISTMTINATLAGAILIGVQLVR
jgi:hypothetical protein